MKRTRRLALFLLLTCLFSMLTGCGSGVFGFGGDSDKFAGNCGVSVYASVVDSPGLPEINIQLENTSGKDIYAIKLYVVPQDVYGDQVKSIFDANNQILIDKEIRAGETYSLNHNFLDDKIKTATIYLYSVFYDDQTEWGDRNASQRTIQEYGKQIPVTGRFD